MHRELPLFVHTQSGSSLVLHSLLAGALMFVVDAGLASAADQPSATQTGGSQATLEIPLRPKVPGRFQLSLQSRRETTKGSGEWVSRVKKVEWNTAETMIIICDMWDGHYCQLAAQRVDAMAPRMNRVITAARNHGTMVIHAPSGTMKHYAQTPFRKRMQQLPAAKPPIELQGWCHLDSDREAPLPVDTSKQACDDPVVGEAVRRFSKQHAAIKIIGYDGISDNGQEIYNFIHIGKIKNVVLMGVHTNMCVLGRPFGIRQMARLGLNVVLARDLTDAMYDPREFPYVSHTRGTELVVEHIEKYWCPSILGDDLTKVVPGSADPTAEVAKRDVQPVTDAKP